jgi:hypothetical protein
VKRSEAKKTRQHFHSLLKERVYEVRKLLRTSWLAQTSLDLDLMDPEAEMKLGQSAADLR